MNLPHVGGRGRRRTQSETDTRLLTAGFGCGLPIHVTMIPATLPGERLLTVVPKCVTTSGSGAGL